MVGCCDASLTGRSETNPPSPFHRNRRLSKQRHTLVQTPGPVDPRTFAVIGDGAHFDLVWWRTQNAILLASPVGLPRLPPREATLSPDMGAAGGLMLLLGADHQGCFRLALNNQEPCSEDLFNAFIDNGRTQDLMTAIERWISPVRSAPPYSIAIIGCKVPLPPYQDIDSDNGALAGLIQRIHISPPSQGDTEQTLLVITYDTNTCHIGEIHAPNASPALTRLRRHEASEVTWGHRGL